MSLYISADEIFGAGKSSSILYRIRSLTPKNIKNNDEIKETILMVQTDHHSN